jgi:cell division protein FtsB
VSTSLTAPPRRRASYTGRAVVLVLVLIALAFMLAVPIRSWAAQRSQIASLEEQVAEAAATVKSLQVDQERWTDPAFIAAEARRRLHFVMPGEIGYVALGADGAPVSETQLEGPAPSWASQLWSSVREADTPPVATITP